jgi:hypothetical protein
MTATPDLSFLPRWLVDESPAGVPRVLRPFGSAEEDLGVEFHLAPRPELITELLVRCSRDAAGRPTDRRRVLEWPVGLRIEVLVALAALADPRPFRWRLRCAATVCAQDSEFELTAEQILTLGDERRDQPTTTFWIGEREAVLRRPTGRDQAAWLAQPPDEDSAAMLRSILLRPSLEDLLAAGLSLEAIALAVDAAMDRFDPLIGFHLSVVCPHCGKPSDVTPDLVGRALDRLAGAQQALIEDVHRLASRYHWSERQILELPKWRRQSYLDLIDATAG